MVFSFERIEKENLMLKYLLSYFHTISLQIKVSYDIIRIFIISSGGIRDERTNNERYDRVFEKCNGNGNIA